MKTLSLVTAKVVRENEQYRYKLVGRGEKYLVKHEDTDNAGDIAIKELSPFSKEPIIIEQTILQKKTEIIGDEDSDYVYKVSAVSVFLEESGKEKKSRQNYFVCAESIEDALEVAREFFESFFSDVSIISIAMTKIIDIIK